VVAYAFTWSLCKYVFSYTVTFLWKINQFIYFKYPSTQLILTLVVLWYWFTDDQCSVHVTCKNCHWRAFITSYTKLVYVIGNTVGGSKTIVATCHSLGLFSGFSLINKSENLVFTVRMYAGSFVHLGWCYLSNTDISSFPGRARDWTFKCK
jgi:hypothetical protein